MHVEDQFVCALVLKHKSVCECVRLCARARERLCDCNIEIFLQ